MQFTWTSRNFKYFDNNGSDIVNNDISVVNQIHRFILDTIDTIKTMETFVVI